MGCLTINCEAFVVLALMRLACGMCRCNPAPATHRHPFTPIEFAVARIAIKRVVARTAPQVVIATRAAHLVTPAHNEEVHRQVAVKVF